MNDNKMTLEELPEIKFLFVKNKVYPFSEEITDKVSLMMLMESSYENLENGGPGFISLIGESKKGGYIRLNNEGISYFKQNILPLINPKTKTHAFEQYEGKLHGTGQRSDISEDGFIPGIKHSPSIIEQNYFSQTDSYVDVPTPDEFFMGPRGETITSDKNGLPSMDTFKFVTRYSQN